MSHFGITTNGASHGYTMGSDERDEIALRLPNMDGRDVWAYSIWPFPDGVDFEDVDKEEARGSGSPGCPVQTCSIRVFMRLLRHQSTGCRGLIRAHSDPADGFRTPF